MLKTPTKNKENKEKQAELLVLSWLWPPRSEVDTGSLCNLSTCGISRHLIKGFQWVQQHGGSQRLPRGGGGGDLDGNNLFAAQGGPSRD